MLRLGMMEVVFTQAYWLALWGTAFSVLVLVPLALVATTAGATRVRRSVCLLVGYVLTTVFLGWYAYTWVPVQYAWQLDFTPPRTANSLAAVHTKLAGANPSASTVRIQVEQERWSFVRGWAIATAGGFILLVVLLRLIERRTRFSSLRPLSFR
jgi:hypothetical protein